ncbi:isopentenyl-diphosphate Delta-isomerase [Streptomyces sp. NPDC050211]|uniref:isopentenyl-diphosphate Delta-isomerase n=1 Tax=Streptomyces sp. NPDC050211 TaxID=3154932 RepID=UPI003423F17E
MSQRDRENLTVELVDANGNTTGTATVEDAHRNPGKRHRAFSAMLFDGKGNALIQRRAAGKLRFAGQWGPSTCGHPFPGETLSTAGQRRIFEELGASGVEVHEVGHVEYRITEPGGAYTEEEYDHVLIGFYNGTPRPDPEEIDEVRWIPVDELTKELANPSEGNVYGEWLKLVWETALPAAVESGAVRIESPQVHSDQEANTYAYYEYKRADTINIAAGDDDYVHSHFSVVPFNRAVLDLEGPARERAILRELHRLENIQSQEVLALCGDISPNARLLDTGCGRGGTAFHAYERFGCHVDGVDFSPFRVEHANSVARQRGITDRVAFYVGNMTSTGRPADHYDAVYVNEAAMHLESMYELCEEVARVLKPGGRFVFVEWTADDIAARQGAEVSAIDKNYYTCIQLRANALDAMLQNRLVPRRIEDRAKDVLPYWELRSESDHRTGVEEPFLRAFGNNILNYFMVMCDYQPEWTGEQRT